MNDMATSSSMRAAIWTATDQVDVIELPMPDVPQGWALVKVAYNGICGTDLAILHDLGPGRAGRCHRAWRGDPGRRRAPGQLR